MMSSSSEPGKAGHSVHLEELIALRDGELSTEHATELLERIATDPHAGELLDQLDQTDTILAQLRNKPMPPDVREAIHRRLADESQQRDHGDET